jgi:hypothetical protein
MSADVTIDEVKRRAAVAGVRIREDRWEMVRALVADALRPIRRIDSRAITSLEPAGTFDASGGAAPAGSAGEMPGGAR